MIDYNYMGYKLTSTNIFSVTACEKHDLNRINQDNAKQINCAKIHT